MKSVCVCCGEEVDIRIMGAPQQCSKCHEMLGKYSDAVKKQEEFYRKLQGYEPMQINEHAEDRGELQQLNDDLEKMVLELRRLQICVYNLGQNHLKERG
jgi:hypothetical protein